MGGVGVRAFLVSDNSVKIYKNCGCSQRNITLPDCHGEQLVDFQPSPRIEVFMKVLHIEAEKRNTQFSSEKDISALHKEIRRTRAGAFRVIGGAPVGVAFYDVINADGSWHDIHQLAFFQEYADGRTTFNLLYTLLTNNVHSFLFHVRNVLRRFIEYRDLQDEHASADRLTEAWEAVTTLTDQANEEVWMRFRLLISIVDVVCHRGLQLWKDGLYHCDMHSENIMHLLTYERDELTVVDMLTSGRGYVPSMNLYYSKNVLSRTAAARLNKQNDNGKVGLPVVWFRSLDVRYIDIGMLMELPKDVDTNLPCKEYRPSAQEDLNEIIRTVTTIAFDVDALKLPPFERLPEMQSVFRDEAGRVIQQSLTDNWMRMLSVAREMRDELHAIQEVADCKPAFIAARTNISNGNVKCSTMQMIAGATKMRSLMRSKARTRIPVDVFFQNPL